jgi:hypothetical protein
MTDNEQLIAQAREILAKAMNCSDLAQEGAWVARETVNGLPPNNYWAVTATRTPTAKGVAPFTVWKAHVNTPAMAGLLTFISTALPQLCDRLEAAEARALAAEASLEWKPDREAVAGIVDRGAWRDMEGRWEDDSRWLSEDHRKGCLGERQEYALSKADAILSLNAGKPS